MEIYRTTLKNKNPLLILSNGSERGDYIPLDYITKSFGRIHDGIQLMKTYYPNDKKWSTSNKISDITNKTNVNYAWDYEYEDYHPLDIFTDNSATLKQFYDIKEHGADIHLTLTMDLGLKDRDIVDIIKVLSQFGKIYFRINHESNGRWFRYNKLNSYKEVSDFFVRCHKLIKQHSTNIFTVFNITGDFFVNDKLVIDQFLHFSKSELHEALEISDYWSIDKYISLNYAWPFEETYTKEDRQFKGSIDDWWRIIEETYLKMIWHNNLKAKPLFINEFNSDSDVDGYENQGIIIANIYDRLKKGEFEWLKGITMYQFRDYGGLGLEKGTIDEFTRLPAFDSYKKSISNFNYDFIADNKKLDNPDFYFRWDDLDNIVGLELTNISSKQIFKNKFDYPIFIVDKELNNWQKVGIWEDIDISKLESLILLIPPYDSCGLNSNVLVRCIREKLEEVIR